MNTFYSIMAVTSNKWGKNFAIVGIFAVEHTATRRHLQPNNLRTQKMPTLDLDLKEGSK